MCFVFGNGRLESSFQLCRTACVSLARSGIVQTDLAVVLPSLEPKQGKMQKCVSCLDRPSTCFV